MENSNPKKTLDLYMHDLFVKVNMNEVAESLRTIANLQPHDAVKIDTPKGFLYDWYVALSEECISGLEEVDRYPPTPSIDVSQTRAFLNKWVPLLLEGGVCLLEWFSLFHDRYCAKINLTQLHSSPKVCSIDQEIAKQELRKMTAEMIWLGVGERSWRLVVKEEEEQQDEPNAVAKNIVRAPPRLRRLGDWFSEKYCAELEKHTKDATKPSSRVLIHDLFPIFVHNYSYEIVNRPNATQGASGSTKIIFDGEVGRLVIRKMVANPKMRLEATNTRNSESEETKQKYIEIVKQAGHEIASRSGMLETKKLWNSNKEAGIKRKKLLDDLAAAAILSKSRK